MYLNLPLRFWFFELMDIEGLLSGHRKSLQKVIVILITEKEVSAWKNYWTNAGKSVIISCEIR